MTAFQTGKRPAAPRASDLKFASYIDRTILPTAPPAFGYDGFTREWGMLGNDTVGDCVWAGAAHEHMVFTGGNHRTPVPFSDASVLSDYSAATGYDPADPNSDQGTDVHEAMAYRRKKGILDANGDRHQIGAYLSLEPGNYEELFQAAYIFEAVGIGIQFPESAMRQFNNGYGWSYVAGSPIEGGHYVAVTGRASSTLAKLVTWGRRITMTTQFYEKLCDEAWAYVTPDQLAGARSLRGFSLDQLNADLAAL